MKDTILRNGGEPDFLVWEACHHADKSQKADTQNANAM